MEEGVRDGGKASLCSAEARKERQPPAGGRGEKKDCSLRQRSAGDWAAAALRRLTGLGVPIVRGKFGIPQLLLPKRTDVHVRWGVPIVVERDPSPSDERVEELFQTYMGHLRDLFDAFAYECLPPEVAARGLKITRMDGGRVPPQGPLVAPLRPTGPNRHGVLEPKVAPAMSRL